MSVIWSKRCDYIERDTTKLATPSQKGKLTYNGKTQTPVWENYDENKMNISGTQSATNAGTYAVTFTPKEGYTWRNGTTDSLEVTWKIQKVTYSLKLTPGTLTLSLVNDVNGKNVTFTSDAFGKVSIQNAKSGANRFEIKSKDITDTEKLLTIIPKATGSFSIYYTIAGSENVNGSVSNTLTGSIQS